MITPRVVAAIGCAIGLLFIPLCSARPAAASARPCDVARAGVPLHTFQLSIGGIETARRTVALPTGTRVLITTTQSGVDVRVDVRGGDGVVHSSDTPVRRLGPQRVLLQSDAAGTVELTLTGKESTQGRGGARVTFMNLSSGALPAECITAIESLTQADARYARAQAISLGINPTSRADAKQDYAEAAKLYQLAARATLALGDEHLSGESELAAAATLYQGSLDWRGARDAAERAAALFGKTHDDYRAARARAMGAAAEMEIAFDSGSAEGLRAVRASFLSLAAWHEARNEKYDRALALNNAGLACYYALEFDDAIRTFEQAVPLYAALHERVREAQVLQNIAIVQHEIGRVTQIRATFARVLSLVHETDAPRLYADVLNNLAVEESDEDDFDAALKHYSDALRILTRLQATREQARSLDGIGAVYYAVGSRSLALDYFAKALEIRTAQLDPRGRLSTLRAIANALADAGRWTEALSRRQEALTLAVSPQQKARLLIEIGMDTASAGRTDEAYALIERALTSESGGNPVVMGRALMARAHLGRSRGDYEAVTRDAHAAGEIFRTRGMPSAQFGTLLLAARAAHDAGKVDLAAMTIDQALGLAEHVRTLSANPELRASLWNPLRPAFDLKIALLRERSTPASSQTLETLAVAERSRDRALADFQARVPARPVSVVMPVQERVRDLYREIAERRMQLESRLDRVGEDDDRSRAIRADITTLSRELDLSTNAVPLTPAAVSPRSADALRRVIQTVPPDTTVIEYWLGEQNAYAWTLSQNGQAFIELGSSSRIEKVAREFHASLSNFSTVPREERLRLAKELHGLIVAPLPPSAIRSRTLLFIPDGALHYVPFAALCPDASGLRCLIDEHDVALGSSVFTLLATRKEAVQPAKRDILIVSDPVYSGDDERLAPRRRTPDPAVASQVTSLLSVRGASGSGSWSRLRGSAREAAAIASLFPAGSVDMLTGAGATREAFLAKIRSPYRIVHIAAHGVADVEAPRLSALVLSTVSATGLPIAGEVFAGDLLQHPLDADLIVLSACETSLGKEAAGEGLLGLRYVAHANGARAVVASLWAVSDRVGAELMAKFYARFVRDGESTIESLSDAMRAERRVLPDPAYWGTFQLSLLGLTTKEHLHGELGAKMADQ